MFFGFVLYFICFLLYFVLLFCILYVYLFLAWAVLFRLDAVSYGHSDVINPNCQLFRETLLPVPAQAQELKRHAISSQIANCICHKLQNAFVSEPLLPMPAEVQPRGQKAANIIPGNNIWQQCNGVLYWHPPINLVYNAMESNIAKGQKTTT